MRASRPPRRVGVTEREEFSNVRKLNVGTLDAGRCSFERDVGPTSSQRLEASLCEDSHSTSDYLSSTQSESLGSGRVLLDCSTVPGGGAGRSEEQPHSCFNLKTLPATPLATAHSPRRRRRQHHTWVAVVVGSVVVVVVAN